MGAGAGNNGCIWRARFYILLFLNRKEASAMGFFRRKKIDC